PVADPISGMMISPTSEFTMAPKAAPMMTPTARSTTLPFIANSRNSLSISSPPLLSIPSGYNVSARPGPSSVDQAGMHHGATHGYSRRFRHRHHRQPQALLDLAKQ